jgi:N-acetyl-gamma-glutamyl-phosphate reductase
MIKAAVIGAAGYAGGEAVRLLHQHPQAELCALVGNSNAGNMLSEISPWFQNLVTMPVEALDVDKLVDECKADVAFLALPAGVSAETAVALLARGVKVIDLGADFRFHDAAVYEKWYKKQHPHPELLPEAVYGLPEIWRDEVCGASLIGNPGCYPTSVQLALYPLLAAGLADLSKPIIADCKSGITGAGRNAQKHLLFCEANDSINAYGVAGHRHTPEIEGGLSRMAGEAASVLFTPHLTPMSRGILSTIYVSLKKSVPEAELREIYTEAYAKEYFVRFLPQDVWPHTKWVSGSNFCDINLKLDERTGLLVVSAAIDNIVKGAAGQAVQNMNIMFDLPETTGLEQIPMMP